MPPALSVIGPKASSAHDQAGQPRAGHHGDADAVDPGEAVGGQDAADDDQRGQRRGLQARREALDDVRRVPGLGGLGGLAHRAEAGRRVVVGDDEQQRVTPIPTSVQR